MACTIAVARRGQQRSLIRIFQVLSVAMARSHRARIFAWARLTAFCGVRLLPATRSLGTGCRRGLLREPLDPGHGRGRSSRSRRAGRWRRGHNAGGRDADLESDGEAGVGVAVAQMGQGEQGLPAGLESAPRESRCWRWARMRSARWCRVRLDNGIVAG